VAYFPLTHLAWSAQDYPHFEAIRAPLMSRIRGRLFGLLSFEPVEYVTAPPIWTFLWKCSIPRAKDCSNSEANIKPALLGHSQLAVETEQQCRHSISILVPGNVSWNCYGKSTETHGRNLRRATRQGSAGKWRRDHADDSHRAAAGCSLADVRESARPAWQSPLLPASVDLKVDR
jgi:hypothetical protein